MTYEQQTRFLKLCEDVELARWRMGICSQKALQVFRVLESLGADLNFLKDNETIGKNVDMDVVISDTEKKLRNLFRDSDWLPLEIGILYDSREDEE